MDNMVKLLEFYKGKTVLITGHTGFKGAWLSKILILSGAKVVGYSLDPNTKPNLYEILELENDMISIIGDVRDFKALSAVFKKYEPEFVFHLAAQAIVRESYLMPRYTYDTNIMGTINVLECIRKSNTVKSFINVTTDKVYENDDRIDYAFVEDDKLNGYDPYSNSKSCSELVTDSYSKSFLQDKNIRVSTARAGNVIGGGDFAKDRIIPDCVRSVENKGVLVIRNPNSIRPYQFVLEPLICYLMICKEQVFKKELQGSYNIGPDLDDCVRTEILVKLFANEFPNDFKYKIQSSSGPHESAFLRLDNNKIKRTFSWRPQTTIKDAINLTSEWTKAYLSKKDIKKITESQIKSFLGFANEKI